MYVFLEDLDEYASRAASRACRATANADLVIGRVVAIPQSRAPTDPRIPTEHVHHSPPRGAVRIGRPDGAVPEVPASSGRLMMMRGVTTSIR